MVDQEMSEPEPFVQNSLEQDSEDPTRVRGERAHCGDIGPATDQYLANYNQVKSNGLENYPMEAFSSLARFDEATLEEITHFLNCLIKLAEGKYHKDYKENETCVAEEQKQLIAEWELNEFLKDCCSIWQEVSMPWRNFTETDLDKDPRRQVDQTYTEGKMAITNDNKYKPDVMFHLRKSGKCLCSNCQAIFEHCSGEKGKGAKHIGQCVRGFRFLHMYQLAHYMLSGFIECGQLRFIYDDRDTCVVSEPIDLSPVKRDQLNDEQFKTRMEHIEFFANGMKTINLNADGRYGPLKSVQDFGTHEKWEIGQSEVRDKHLQIHTTFKLPNGDIYSTLEGDKNCSTRRDGLRAPNYALGWRLKKVEVPEKADTKAEFFLKVELTKKLGLPVMTPDGPAKVNSELNVHALQAKHGVMSRLGFIGMATGPKSEIVPKLGTPFRATSDTPSEDTNQLPICFRPDSNSTGLDYSNKKRTLKSPFPYRPSSRSGGPRAGPKSTELGRAAKKVKTQGTSGISCGVGPAFTTFLLMKARGTMAEMIATALERQPESDGLWGWCQSMARANLGALVCLCENEIVLGITHADYSFDNVFLVNQDIDDEGTPDPAEDREWRLEGTLGDFGIINIVDHKSIAPFRHTGTLPFISPCLSYHLLGNSNEDFERDLVHEMDSNFIGFIQIFMITLCLRDKVKYQKGRSEWLDLYYTRYELTNSKVFKTLKPLMAGTDAFKNSIFPNADLSVTEERKYQNSPEGWLYTLICDMYDVLFSIPLQKIAASRKALGKDHDQLYPEFNKHRKAIKYQIARAVIEAYDKALGEDAGMKQMQSCLRRDASKRKNGHDAYAVFGC